MICETRTYLTNVLLYQLSNPKEVMMKLEQTLLNKEESGNWDKFMIGHLGSITSKIIEACFPSGQVKRFPKNNLALMTISGAKGSQVNFSQISCLLGQQELEGLSFSTCFNTGSFSFLFSCLNAHNIHRLSLSLVTFLLLLKVDECLAWSLVEHCLVLNPTTQVHVQVAGLLTVS
jgi:hypothetical protein